MLTIVIAVVCAVMAGEAAYFTLGSIEWAILCGVGAFIIPNAVITYVTRKRLQKLINGVQQKVQREQAQLQRRMGQMQQKMAGKGLQQQMEKKQAESMRQAIQDLDQAEPLCKWNFLTKRQINTLKASFYYQIKDFKNAEEHLRKCIYSEPLVLAMHMAMEYSHNNMTKVKKLYKKGKRRFRKEKGALIYALYSWILVQQDRAGEALDVLATGKDKTEDPTLSENWSHLANGRVQSFSNSEFGEQWYALHLEKPKRAKSRGGKKRWKK